MSARAIWKASVHFEAFQVPVKLYSAVQDRTVHFRLLESERHSPVQQHLVHPGTQEVVPYQEVRRGMPLDDGSLVILQPEELASAEPAPSRTIELVHLLPRGSIGHAWYVRPYYLGPDGDPAAYFALEAALSGAGKEALAHWVMRKKEYWGVLRAEGAYLMLDTLRLADEVIEPAALPRPSGRPYSDKEARMAEQLVGSFVDHFDPAAYRDTYRERVLAFLEQKAQGKRVKLEKPAPKPTRPNLEEALEKSLAAVRKDKQHAARQAS